MSKKIEAPNFTQVPNVVLDYWMNVLTPAEFKVLMCICRKTFGWHKTADRISRNQIAKLTNLNRDTIRKCLHVLEEHGLIIKFESISEYGGSDANTYEIHIEYIDKNPEVGVSEAPPLGVSNAPGGRIERPTKETIQNKDISKETTNPEVVVFSDLEISEGLKSTIIKNHDLEAIVLAVKRVKAWEDRENDEAAIITCLERKTTWKDVSTDSPESNKEYALSLPHYKSEYAEMELLNKAVEIKFFGCSKESIEIKYDEKSFKEKLIKALKECRLMT